MEKEEKEKEIDSASKENAETQPDSAARKEIINQKQPQTLREALTEYIQEVKKRNPSHAISLPMPRSVSSNIAYSSYTPDSFIEAALAKTRTQQDLTLLYDELEDQYGIRPRLPLSDTLLFGGFHRRFVNADSEHLQDPTIDHRRPLVLRPSERPTKFSASHGVFSVYNNMADEKQQVMSNTLSEGTFGGGKYPLHYAAYKGDLAKAKKLLKKSVWYKSGASVCVEDNLRGRTPLHVACATGHRNVVEILLKASSVELNSVDHWGWSPLMYAVHAGHEEIARFLISSRGADVCIRGNNGETAHSLSTIEHRGFALQRKALTCFIRNTEDNLTMQSAADGWPCTFGNVVHKTRPLPPYKKATVTFDMNGGRMQLKYRAGNFGLRWATRYFNLNKIGWPGDEESDPDPTFIQFAEARASQAGERAAMAGHVRGLGSKIEKWMRKSSEGNVIVEVVCEGGWVLERSEEEETIHIGNEIKGEGMPVQAPIITHPVPSIRLEIPIPDGLDPSYILRFLDMRVSHGKRQSVLDFQAQQAEIEARKAALRPKKGITAALRRFSTKLLRK